MHRRVRTRRTWAFCLSVSCCPCSTLLLAEGQEREEAKEREEGEEGEEAEEQQEGAQGSQMVKHCETVDGLLHQGDQDLKQEEPAISSAG